MSETKPGPALFAGLVRDEWDKPVDVALVGDVPHYVIDDAGFLRHVEAEGVDRQVIAMLREQFMAHRELATEAMLQMLGKDDLFTKAMIDASIKNMDQILQQGLPDDARSWLGMLGFRVVIGVRGQVLELEMPEQEIDFDG